MVCFFTSRQTHRYTDRQRQRQRQRERESRTDRNRETEYRQHPIVLYPT